MAFLDIEQINYIGISDKQLILNLNSNVKNLNLVADIDMFTNKFENSDLFGNNFSAIKIDDNIIHNLYNLQDLCLKSTNIKNFYNPNIDNLIGFTYLNNSIFALSDLSKNKFKNLQLNLNNDLTYSFNYKPLDLNTYFYDTPFNKKRNLVEYFEPVFNNKNIFYNFLYEISLNLQNNLKTGDLLSECFCCKNLYNFNYSIEMTSQTTILNSRKYIGINTCSNNVFLKYYDNINYNDNYSENNNKNNYQKIESIYSLNKFKTLETEHKSNMYSIKLHNTGLNSLIENEDDKTDKTIINLFKKIKLDITNNIKEITKNICPANTELFNVYFEGE